MLTGQMLLIDLLEAALASFTNGQKRNLSFDNTEYKTFLTSFNSPNVLAELPEAMLISLVANIEPKEKQKSFEASIRFLKGLAILAKEKPVEVHFNQAQLVTIEELKELIRRSIEHNDFLIKTMSKKTKKIKIKYQELLNVVKNEGLISVSDYDLIEVLIRNLSGDTDGILDNVMTYLNARNAKILSGIAGGVADLELAAHDEPTILVPEEVQINDENDVSETLEFENWGKELALAAIENSGFGAGTVPELTEELPVILNEPEPQVENFSQSAELKFQEIFNSLGFNYEELLSGFKPTLMTTRTPQEIETVALYLKEQVPVVLSNISKTNPVALVYILCSSNPVIIEKVITDLIRVHNINESELRNILNLMTPIFGVEGSENYLANSALIAEYGVPLSVIIDNSLSFLVANHHKIKAIIRRLNRYGANIKTIIEKCPVIFNNTALLRKNMKILKMYGFDLRSFFAENAACYVLLNNHDLATKLDQFIEIGLNEHIHNSPMPGNTLRALIIKRVFYAFKNQMPAWLASENNSPSPLHNEVFKFNAYDEIVKNSDYFIVEPDISLLVAEHPIVELIDEACRPAIYSNTPIALLKRKTELLFGKKVISRLKTYRVFKILVAQGVKESEALMFALTYNSILEDEEYNGIKLTVERLGLG